MRTILALDQFDTEAMQWLGSQDGFQLETAKDFFSASVEAKSAASALLIRSRTKVTEAFLHSLPKLELIITATSGFDHIDLQATQQRGLTVMHTPLAHVESAAELTMTLLLNGLRKLQPLQLQMRKDPWRMETDRGNLLHRKTLGIIGLGRIGSRVAQLAQAFRMTVIAFDPYLSESVFKNLEVERVSWEECLKRSDAVTFHVPLTAETHHMLSRSSLELLSPHIFVVNASRGSVIHEGDLLEALQRKKILGCALDVFEKEPLNRHSDFYKFPEVVLSPHAGAFTHEALKEAGWDASRKVVQFFRFGATTDVLPPQAEWWQTQGSFKAALI